MTFETTRYYAEQMDMTDELKNIRDQFFIPKTSQGLDAVYFSGNSLGLAPKQTKNYVETELDAWQKLTAAELSHGRHAWLDYHTLVTQSLARLVGAEPTEVIAMNSLTVNLHLLMTSFYRPTATRYKILMEGGAFPADQYAIKSQLALHGFAVNEALIEIHPEEGQYCLDENKLLATLEKHGNEIALVFLGAVNFRSGQRFNLQKIAELAQRYDCKIGIDAAHAIGNVELNLHAWQIDFAVWCHYKYINAGPGAIGGAFIHEKHLKDNTLPRLAGWWGHNKKTRFAMPNDFDPIQTAEGWQISNPPILQLACLRAALDIFDQVDLKKLRQKSHKLTDYFVFLLETSLPNRIKIVTPKLPDRGAQLSFQMTGTDAGLIPYLLSNGFYCDYRPPDLIRATPVPLYNRFIDVFNFVEFLKKIP